MAKKQSNAAEELEQDAAEIQVDIEEGELEAPESPQLEVVDGDAMVSNEEIQALLDTMAESNVADTAAEEVTAESPVPEPEVVAESAEVEEAAPKLTMDDVLRAASSATNMSIDEIKNLEAPSTELEEEPIEANADSGDLTASMMDDAPAEAPLLETQAFESPKASSGEHAKGTEKANKKPDAKSAQDKTKGGTSKFAVVNALPRVAPFAVALIAAGLAFGASMMSTRQLAAQSSARDKKLTEAVAGLETMVSNQNDRLASFDKFLSGGTVIASTKTPGHGEQSLAAQVAHGDSHQVADNNGHTNGKGEHSEAKGHDAHATNGNSHETGHGKDHGTSEGAHGEAGHSGTPNTDAQKPGTVAKDSHGSPSSGHVKGSGHGSDSGHEKVASNGSHGDTKAHSGKTSPGTQHERDAKLHATGAEGFKVAQTAKKPEAWHKEPHEVITSETHSAKSSGRKHTSHKTTPKRHGAAKKRGGSHKGNTLVASNQKSGTIKVYLEDSHVGSSH